MERWDKMGKITVKAVAVLFVLLGMAGGGTAAKLKYQDSTSAVNTIAGLEQLHKMDQAKAAEVEQEIKAIRSRRTKAAKQKMEEKNNQTAKQSPEKENETSMKIRFQNTVVIGDSITEGLADYGILESSSVLARRGSRVDELDEDIKTAIGLSPSKVFFAMGMNDIEYCNGDSKLFTDRYRSKIEELKKGLPNVSIYINSILPVQQKAIDNKPIFSHVSQFNEAIKQMCKEENITFIENGSYIKGIDSMYEADGIHVVPAYYPKWAAHMAEAAGL